LCLVICLFTALTTTAQDTASLAISEKAFGHPNPHEAGPQIALDCLGTQQQKNFFKEKS